MTAAELRAVLDRAVETIAGEISQFRTEVNDRLGAIERRLDNQVTAVEHIGNRISAMTKYEDRIDRDNTALTTNYHAQARDLRELRARIEALEAKQPPQ